MNRLIPAILATILLGCGSEDEVGLSRQAIGGNGDLSAGALEERIASYVLVAAFADSLITRELREDVPPQETRLDAASDADRAALGILAERMGSRLLDAGEAQDLIMCSAPGAADCTTRDGSRAGFHLLSSSFSDSAATVSVLTWMLIFLDDPAWSVPYTRVDRLHLVRTDSEWRLDESVQLSES